MAWLEAHQSLGLHPKTRKASRLLGITRPTLLGHLFLLWWWALDYAPDGDVTRYGADELALAAEWDGDPEQFVAALIECRFGDGAGFLERTDEGRLLIHDWWDYAGKLVQRRRDDAERKAAERREAGRRRDVQDAPSFNSAPVQGPSDGHPPDAPTDGVRREPTQQTDTTGQTARAGKPAATPPDALKPMAAVLDGLKGYVPTDAFYAKVAAKYGHLDLEEEAIKARDWLAKRKARGCSTSFILNWLQKAADDAAATVTPLGRNGKAPPPIQYPPPPDLSGKDPVRPEDLAAYRQKLGATLRVVGGSR